MADVNVIFGAKIDELITGVEGAKHAMEGFKSSIEEMFSMLEKVVAITAGGALFGKLVSDANEAASEVLKLSKVLGVSAEEASPLRVELETLGIGVDTYVGAITRLDRQVRTNEATMNRWGVVTRDANGKVLEQSQLLGNALSTWQSFREGADRNIASQILFGARTGEVSQLLKITSASMAQAKKDTEELGLEFSKADLAGMRAFKVSMNEVKLTIEAIERPIAEALIPALTEMGNQFRAAGPQAVSAMRTAVEGLVSVFGSLKAAVLSVYDGLKDLFGLLGPGTAEMHTFKELIDGTAIAFAQLSAWAQIGVASLRYLFDGAKWHAEVERIVGDLDRMKAAIRGIGGEGDLGKQLGLDAITGGKSGGRDVSGLLVNKDAVSAAKANLDEQIAAVKAHYEQLKILEKNAVDTFKETEGQKVSHLLAALAQRATETAALYDKEIAVAGTTAAKIAEIEKAKAAALNEIDKERATLVAEQLKKTAQEWESVGNTIVGAWNSQLKGLLAGTTSWSQAMKNIAADLVIKIIEEFEKLAIVKPLTAMLTSSLSAPTELFASLIKAISSMFGPLMAGFTSFFAPTLGPAAPAAGAAAAGAEVAAAVGAVGHEFGTSLVPRTGLAFLHAGEAVIPSWNNPFAGGGAGGGGTANLSFNVTALDARGVQAFFNRFGPQIAKSLSAHMNLNPSFGQ